MVDPSFKTASLEARNTERCVNGSKNSRTASSTNCSVFIAATTSPSLSAFPGLLARRWHSGFLQTKRASRAWSLQSRLNSTERTSCLALCVLYYEIVLKSTDVFLFLYLRTRIFIRLRPAVRTHIPSEVDWKRAAHVRAIIILKTESRVKVERAAAEPAVSEWSDEAEYPCHVNGFVDISTDG